MVQALDDLLKRPEFFSYGIIVRKNDYLYDFELHILTEFPEELPGGQRISSEAVGNEAKSFWEFILKLFEAIRIAMIHGPTLLLEEARYPMMKGLQNQ